MTTKIHVVADALRRPLRFILTGGEAHDITTAPDLLADLAAHGVIADKAYDSDALRERLARRGIALIARIARTGRNRRRKMVAR